MQKIVISQEDESNQILVDSEGEKVGTEFMFHSLLALIKALSAERGIKKNTLIKFLIGNIDEILSNQAKESGEPINEVEESID